MIDIMQFHPYGQQAMRQGEPRALAERLTYMEGIRHATVRDTLRHIFSLATQLRLDFYVLQTSNGELAQVMDVTPRTVQNRLREIVELGLPHLKITHDEHGQIIEFDLSTYYKGHEIGGEVPHEIGGEIKNKGGVKYPTKYPTKSEVGTERATCTGVTIPPSLTEKEEEEAHVRSGEKVNAVPPADLHQFVTQEIRSRGWIAPAPSTVTVIVDHLEAHLERELDRKASVIATLDRLDKRRRAGESVAEYVVVNLCSDCQSFAPSSQPKRHVKPGMETREELMESLAATHAAPEVAISAAPELTPQSIRSLIECSEQSVFAQEAFEVAKRERLRDQLAKLEEVAA